ncbi:MAG TPA: helix-turn-helix domain-containing protein [Solirubrobacterales bacterium]|nr:helix-turn-helix domain-containing protein [Solirubrobacterales bacterium]
MADGVQSLGRDQRGGSGIQHGLGSRSGVKLDAATPDAHKRAEVRSTTTAAYWPCLLTSVRGKPTDAALSQIRRAARRQDPRNVLVSVEEDDAQQVLFLAADPLEGPHRRHLHDLVSAVVDAVKNGRPGVEIQVVIGDRVEPGAPIALVAARVRRLGRYTAPHGGDPVTWARRDSLARLLDPLDRRDVSAFVHGQLARVQAYDQEHGTDLQHVLELALDHESRNDASRAAFMHRNTFRRQLDRALELIDVDLDSPEQRLALHLALKVRALVDQVPRGTR